MQPRFLPYLAIATTAFGWSLSPVLMRYLNSAYDPYTQAFIRYGCGTLVLLPFSALFYRQELLRLLRRPRTVVPIGLLAMLMTTLWTQSLYLTTATTAILVSKLQVPFVIVLSFMLFHEERGVIRSPLFLAGCLLGFSGVALIVMAKSAASAMPTHTLGILVLVLVGFLWALYAVWGKHLVMHSHAIPMFTIVATYATLGLGVLMLMLGEPHRLLEAGPRVTLIAFLSGAFPIGVAHCTFLYAQKHLGSAFSTSITLLSPLITHLIAAQLWPDEQLVPVQWLGGAILIFGSYLVVQAQRKRGAGPAREPVPAPPE